MKRYPINCQSCGYIGTADWWQEDEETWLAHCPECDRTHALNFADEDEECEHDEIVPTMPGLGRCAHCGYVVNN